MRPSPDLATALRQGGFLARFHSPFAGFMHRDTKLGLALGMLVIGFTVAFCFPRVTPSVQRPATEHVATDPALEFLPIRAYDVPVPATASNDASTSGSAGQEGVQELVPVVGIFPGQTTIPNSGGSTIPRDAASSSLMPGTQTVTSTRPAQQTDIHNPDTHTVQAGDTLSGIATKYLGGPNRYYEIYEANQSLLSTPDALKIGMVLTIPGGNALLASEVEPQPTLAEQLQPPVQQKLVPEPYLTDGAQRTYEVRPGDTLEGIALRHYGTTTVIPMLRKANPAMQDPQQLRVGSLLELPTIR